MHEKKKVWKDIYQNVKGTNLWYSDLFLLTSFQIFLKLTFITCINFKGHILNLMLLEIWLYLTLQNIFLPIQMLSIQDFIYSSSSPWSFLQLSHLNLLKKCLWYQKYGVSYVVCVVAYFIQRSCVSSVLYLWRSKTFCHCLVP